jgi:hypothetical protein
MTKKINEQELEILQRLDSLCEKRNVRDMIDPIIKRVEAQLSQNPDDVMAWETIPLEIYGESLPGGIRSSWVFILRANKTTGAERHPNSIQRMMSYRGTGDMQTYGDDQWLSNQLASDNTTDLISRWVSIPINVWHQPVVGDENWAVVSFQTALADELIEERPDPADPKLTQQRRYLGR